VAPWYLAGAVALANCVAAYQFKGAESQAASYVNLASPGTYDLNPLAAPAFDTATGLAFAGAAWLDTGIVPIGDQTWSMFIQFSDANASDFRSLAEVLEGANAFGISPNYSNAYYFNVTFRYGVGQLAGGNLGFAGKQGYRNGVADGAALSAATKEFSLSLYIGARHMAASTDQKLRGKIQAVSIYNIAHPDPAALATAMAAL
jgi:hypothetical protein